MKKDKHGENQKWLRTKCQMSTLISNFVFRDKCLHLQEVIKN